MEKHFHSNGKLFISGEYLVLDGALAFAIPTGYGQSLTVNPHENGIIWQSYDHQGKLWLDFDLAYAEIKSWKETNSPNNPRERLIQILASAKTLNPDFLNQEEGVKVETRLDFPQDWGLGTSSTLINNVANWAEVNPYKLLARTFGGSGYDLACAESDTAVFYTMTPGHPHIEHTVFKPSFSDHIFFIYLNQKQNSRDAIAHYRNQPKEKLAKAVAKVTRIGHAMQQCENLGAFEELVCRHEEIVGQLLNITPIKLRLFNDYTGSVKSLGGWGGDFIMVTGSKNQMEYFKNKGYTTIIPFNNMAK
ncbi:MAG: GHMP kinase [Cytophagaceae bacterium]|nr:GHMP kinase [Cytophagaceae bacterium]|tara:strand:+ start:6895 stop:7809 length:915 start_codon:yes stop_codon:yes gene_type:complete